MRVTVTIVGLLLCLIDSAPAREIEATPASALQQLGGLQPGDTLTLAPGRYPGGLWLKGLHGRPDAPITIRGKSAQTVLLGKAGTNTMDITDCQWLVIRDLTFDGQGKPVDAIKAGKDTTRCCHHITIENNTIINHGANQQIVGISTKTPCADWTIRGNTILGAGTGLYLGNSDGNQPFVRGLIEYNLVSDPVGYCMQIKRQNARPDIAGLPKEAGTTIIRYNLFIKGDKPSPDGNRPNLLLGGWPDDGPGAQDRYQVYGNVFFHNPRESLVQATGRVSLHDNVFADVPGTALTITPHEGKSPKQIFLYHNTFVQVGRAISVSREPEKEFVVAANLACGEQNASRPWPEGNVLLTASEADKLLLGSRAELGKLDPQPRTPITRVAPQALKPLREDADFGRDFWGNVRKDFHQAGACLPSDQSRPIEAKLRQPVAASQQPK